MAASTHGTISLDDLIALNDEIRALVRAGVPLERGLRSISSDLPGRLGALAASLSARLERGESLVDLLDQRGDEFPRAYRAVVAAGVRSGHLPAALEGIATAARRAAEMRRVMIVSLIYPIAVLFFASVVFLFTANKLAPVITTTASELLDGNLPWWHQPLAAITQMGPDVLAGFWFVFVVAGVVWLYRSSRATTLNAHRIRGVPTVARVLHAGRMAMFADVLALTIEQRVPLDEAVVLAAEASGDRVLIRSCSALADRIRSGSQSTALPDGFPPLLGWLIASGVRQEQFVKSLQQTAAAYRRRAITMGNWLTVYLPIILSAGVGGLIVAFYAFVVMIPFYDLLHRLSLP